jgi:stalled ribosome alternative rescue factor ArfA
LDSPGFRALVEKMKKRKGWFLSKKKSPGKYAFSNFEKKFLDPYGFNVTD